MKEPVLNTKPSLWHSLLPIVFLIFSMVAIIICRGAYAIQDYGQWLLVMGAIMAVGISAFVYSKPLKEMFPGLVMAAKQILPSIPILILIGAVSATWMLSGVVPLLIDYGLKVLSPNTFLLVACLVCSAISVLSGSSWTTIATIGVALMGIGSVMGYSAGWTAGAIISGAYFGDKVSPLSDTTVLASSTCGVPIFSHIRYMMISTIPSMLLALAVFGYVSLFTPHDMILGKSDLVEDLARNFNLTPWLLIVPIATVILILCRCNTYITLIASSLIGLAMMFIFQGHVVTALADTPLPTLWDKIVVALKTLCVSTQLKTGSEMLDSLVSTGGMWGMKATVILISCAILFGGALIGTGMLSTLTEALHKRLTSAASSVSATVATGLTMTGCAGDQFLAIVLTSNIYNSMYRKNRLDSLLLSRTVEDSVSVTSVLIPWTSCGLTQSTVLGLSTLAYAPYCIFNYLSPLMSMFLAWTGIKIKRLKEGQSEEDSSELQPDNNSVYNAKKSNRDNGPKL